MLTDDLLHRWAPGGTLLRIKNDFHATNIVIRPIRTGTRRFKHGTGSWIPLIRPTSVPTLDCWIYKGNSASKAFEPTWLHTVVRTRWPSLLLSFDYSHRAGTGTNDEPNNELGTLRAKKQLRFLLRVWFVFLLLRSLVYPMVHKSD